ncbi:hypothetical protein DRN69_03515 [Candidatus Pacearchaeota archaeon]|nr:MAG: hypothetical protein DRN69_03515 [Candidatus Pacearchaeota archaeon]
MNRNEKFFLEHILESIERIEYHTKNKSRSTFKRSIPTQDIVIRRIEIIGEATKNLSQRIKNKYSEIPWKKIAGTRDVLIHGYFAVDLDLIWDIVKKDLPDLKRKIKKILKELKDE